MTSVHRAPKIMSDHKPSLSSSFSTFHQATPNPSVQTPNNRNDMQLMHGIPQGMGDMLPTGNPQGIPQGFNGVLPSATSQPQWNATGPIAGPNFAQAGATDRNRQNLVDAQDA